MRSVNVAMSIAALFALQGCGGGGGGDAGNADPPAATSAEGLWSGSSSSGRSSIGLVLDDGAFWMIYMVEGNDAIIAGALQGSSTSNNGSFSSSGRDFNFEGLGVNDFTASGNYVEQKSLDGTIRYSGGTEYSFSGDYDSAYELTPRSLADIAGSYSGTAVSSAGQEFAVAEVSAFRGNHGQFCRRLQLHRDHSAPRPRKCLQHCDYLRRRRLYSGDKHRHRCGLPRRRYRQAYRSCTQCIPNRWVPLRRPEAVRTAHGLAGCGSGGGGS